MYETQIGHAADLARVIFVKLRSMVNKGKPPEEQRQGGYVCFLTQTEGDSEPERQTLTMIGAPDKSLQSRCAKLSEEKARRVLAHPEHVSSWQSRDLSADAFGGAIVFTVGRPDMRAALSMSGLPELADEAFVTVLAVRTHWITEDQALQIAAISSNPYTAKLLAEVPG